jgi:hypothetical protein
LRSIINNSGSTQKFHTLIFKDVHSPKNRNNAEDKNSANAKLEDNQSNKTKNEEKDGKIIVQAFMQNGK